MFTRYSRPYFLHVTFDSVFLLVLHASPMRRTVLFFRMQNCAIVHRIFGQWSTRFGSLRLCRPCSIFGQKAWANDRMIYIPNTMVSGVVLRPIQSPGNCVQCVVISVFMHVIKRHWWRAAHIFDAKVQ